MTGSSCAFHAFTITTCSGDCHFFLNGLVALKDHSHSLPLTSVLSVSITSSRTAVFTCNAPRGQGPAQDTSIEQHEHGRDHRQQAFPCWKLLVNQEPSRYS